MPDWKQDRLKASIWAQKLLAGEFGEWVILDTETTGLYGAVPIELAVISKYGSPMINTRIKPLLPIEPGAKVVHGISEEDLINAPTFTDIYPRLKQVLENKLVIIYNSEFDTNVIFKATRLHQLPRIRFKSSCAMMQYSKYVGDWSSYFDNYKWQKLPGKRSHTAYGDCVDVFKLLKMMAKYPVEEEVATITHKLFPPFQIGVKWQKAIKIAFATRDWNSGYYTNWKRDRDFYIRVPKFYRLSDKDIEEKIFRDFK